MLFGQDKVWRHYLNDIIAADMESAIYLYSYQRQLIKTRDYTNYMEVIDLQKYKVYRKNPKVRMALAYRKEVPFIFIVGKN